MPKLESDAHQRLFELCASDALSEVLHPYAFIQGLVFAVSAAPEIPMPENWLPWIINNSKQLTSTEQADELTDLLMKILQHQLKNLSDEKINLPMGVTFNEQDQQPSSLAIWCQGMLLGHSQLEPVWQAAWDKMQVTDKHKLTQLQKDLKHCLYMFTTFADIPLAVKQAEKRGNDQLLNILPKIFLSFPQTLKTYVGLSGRLVDFLPNQFEVYTQKNESGER
ncbi:YecA/YgfB family protein [Paraglaciecola aestuariivivens]